MRCHLVAFVTINTLGCLLLCLLSFSVSVRRRFCSNSSTGFSESRRYSPLAPFSSFASCHSWRIASEILTPSSNVCRGPLFLARRTSLLPGFLAIMAPLQVATLRHVMQFLITPKHALTSSSRAISRWQSPVVRDGSYTPRRQVYT